MGVLGNDHLRRRQGVQIYAGVKLREDLWHVALVIGTSPKQRLVDAVFLLGVPEMRVAFPVAAQDHDVGFDLSRRDVGLHVPRLARVKEAVTKRALHFVRRMCQVDASPRAGPPPALVTTAPIVLVPAVTTF